MVPALAAELVKTGHRLSLEQKAGAAAGYPDALYEARGRISFKTAPH
jgi:NAD/NADP transhydrogenase alpha subunit